MLDLSMVPLKFPGVRVAEPDGTPAQMVELGVDDLGQGDVLIKVAYASLNYKDGLALTGGTPVVRTFPMIGGIDLVGKVISSETADVAVGEMVVATGWDLGVEHPGGYCAYARVPHAWCEKLPESMSPQSAMTIGTAGVTAMLSYMALERNRSRAADLGDLPLVVTGASGGVGSIATLFGARLGYRIAASTGRTVETAYLSSLGASEVVDRRELIEITPGALGSVRFGAGIDSVGGETLANILRCTRPDGTVVACGLAGGADLVMTVHPFILRGIGLIGINSVRPFGNDRRLAWERVTSLVNDVDLAQITQVVALDEVIDFAPKILRGEVRGRVVVAIDQA